MNLRRFILHSLCAALLVFLLLLALAFAGGGPMVFVMAWELIVGWLDFLQRTPPHIIPEWTSLMFVAGCAGATILGVHWFFGWLHGHRTSTATSAENSMSTPWRWRWTLGISGVIGLVCLMAMGLVGIVHQAAWMIASDEPTRVYKGGGYWARHVADRIWQDGVLHGTNATPEGFTMENYREHWGKDYRLFKLVDEHEQLQGVIVWRRPERYGPDFIAVTDEGRQKLFRGHELPKVIELYSARMRPVW